MISLSFCSTFVKRPILFNECLFVAHIDVAQLLRLPAFAELLTSGKHTEQHLFYLRMCKKSLGSFSVRFPLMMLKQFTEE